MTNKALFSMPRQLPRSSRRAIAGCMLGIAACGGDPGPQRVHIDSLPVLPAMLEERHGSVDNPDAGFSNIGGVDVDRDGNLYVLDVTDREIRVYSPDFRLLRKIGRAGNGPGEFQGAPRYGVQGDTVWTISGSGAIQRVALFDRNGTLLSTASLNGLRIPLPQSYGYVRPVAMRPDGRFTAEFNMVAFNSSDPPTGVRDSDSIPVPRVVFDASGAVVDTIGWDEKPPPRMHRAPGSYPESRQTRIVRYNDRPFMVPTPPTIMPLWFALHDGRIVVESPQPVSDADTMFTVTRLTLSRDTVFSTTLFYTPSRYDAAELDSIALGGSVGPMARVGGSAATPPPPDPAVAKLLREDMDFPDFRLPSRTTWVANDESIWVQRADRGASQLRWIVLAPDGRPEGEVQMPLRSRLLWRRDDVLWVSTPDDMDVPWLVRYRIGMGSGRE